MNCDLQVFAWLEGWDFLFWDVEWLACLWVDALACLAVSHIE